MSSVPLSIADLPCASCLLDKNGLLLAVNSPLATVIGAQEADIIGLPITQFILDGHPKGNLSFQQLIEVHTNSDKKQATTIYLQPLTESASLVAVELQFKRVEVGYLVIFQQTTVNRLALSAEQLFDSLNKAYWCWDINADRLYCSAQLLALLGYSGDTVLQGIAFWDMHIHWGELDDILAQRQQLLAGDIDSINIEHAIVTKTGNTKQVNMQAKVINYLNDKPTTLFAIVKDISSTNQLIEDLKQQNAYLMLAEKLSETGHWRWDVVTNELYWSKGVYTIHGVSSKVFTPDINTAINFYIDSDRPKIRQLLEGAVAKKKGFYFKSTIIKNQGQKLKVECLGEVEKNSKGDVVSILGVFKNITKREDVFEKLKLLAMVNYNIKVPIFFIDEQDNVVYQDLSPQLEAKDFVLFNYINFSINEYLEFKGQAKAKGQVKHTNISFDNYLTVFDISVTYESNEGIYIWIVDNVTDKFRKEQQQLVSNRMALLGNTFGNVSHDINNVLGVALGAIEMLELKFAKGEQDISCYINRVKNAIDKGKSVTERLLAFTKKPTVKVVEFDPLLDIEENQPLFEQLLLPTIDFSYHFNGINCSILFPQGEFINIILNLVLNAQDAIREKSMVGKIEITAEITDKGLLALHINDSGIGIEKDKLTKVFDPYYSSKSVNKGNGIGLANVYSTIYKHNGAIELAGHGPLGGAQFTLLFNAKVMNGDKVKKTPKNIALDLDEVPILILDDEESIAEFVSLFLDGHGAFTRYVTNREDLLQVLASKQEFDIFITDMILPDISGRDAASLVKERYPDIKIYSMSGYVGEKDNKWQYPVLRKPFNADELADFLKTN